MDITNDSDRYQTDDILEASFCMAMGASFIDVKQETPGHFIFIFFNPDQCRQLKRDFINNAPAPALSLFSKREMLINQIKNRRGDR